MKLEQQVTSVELSNKLKDLRIEKSSIFFRDYRGSKEDAIEMWQNYASEYGIDNVNCYTVAELGEMLPERIHTHRIGKVFICEEVKGKCMGATDENEANAKTKMLIYLLENKLLDNK